MKKVAMTEMEIVLVIASLIQATTELDSDGAHIAQSLARRLRDELSQQMLDATLGKLKEV